MILVAIGANLPGRDGADPLTTCQRAVRAMHDIPDVRLSTVSRWYETAPVPPSGQPNYVNGIARLEGAIEPPVLLARLQAIEAEAGRRRGVPNAARTLDLDIIAMGDLVCAAPDPVLPHPRAHLRLFVLVPLAEVAPGWMHPVLHRPVEALIAGLPPELVRPI
ncbi:MAG: 2-amino-4-hydroxy-6-hydroxymethyldihydropteridine diphosphokinase [Alphaproteobacteria bacterium]|nr:2-amino-4-hydroxy-6-hydroxymethyldihydropteridine diphosphokinase [Alphaproteobacteria bacterium]